MTDQGQDRVEAAREELRYRPCPECGESMTEVAGHLMCLECRKWDTMDLAEIEVWDSCEAVFRERIAALTERVEQAEADADYWMEHADISSEVAFLDVKERLEQAEAALSERDAVIREQERMLRWVFENFDECLPELDWREWLDEVRARSQEASS